MMKDLTKLYEEGNMKSILREVETQARAGDCSYQDLLKRFQGQDDDAKLTIIRDYLHPEEVRKIHKKEDNLYPETRRQLDFDSRYPIEKMTDPKINLERVEGESDKNYYYRLVTIYSVQLAVIAAYETEKELDRLRRTHESSKNLLVHGDKSHEVFMKEHIRELQAVIRDYEENFPALSDTKKVKEKVTDLSSLL